MVNVEERLSIDDNLAVMVNTTNPFYTFPQNNLFTIISNMLKRTDIIPFPFFNPFYILQKINLPN